MEDNQKIILLNDNIYSYNNDILNNILKKLENIINDLNNDKKKLIL